MKATAATWILASACAALIAATAQAAPPRPRESRHPDPRRGGGEYSGHHRPAHGCHRPTTHAQIAYWGYYPPPPVHGPPPPPVVYCPPPPPPPPPPPAVYYPVYPGFSIVLRF